MVTWTGDTGIQGGICVHGWRWSIDLVGGNQFRRTKHTTYHGQLDLVLPMIRLKACLHSLVLFVDEVRPDHVRNKERYG